MKDEWLFLYRVMMEFRSTAILKLVTLFPIVVDLSSGLAVSLPMSTIRFNIFMTPFFINISVKCPTVGHLWANKRLFIYFFSAFGCLIVGE